eukprot:gene6458-10464_t
MLKQIFILLFCLLALTQGNYVVQRIHPKEDTNCDNPFVYGGLSEANKCHTTPGGIQKHTCNSTHVSVSGSCNGDCSQCQYKLDYPKDKCIPGFFGMKMSCQEELPPVNKKGIYVRSYVNSQCQVFPSHGEAGSFITDTYCMNGGPTKDMKSQGSFYDENEKVYVINYYDENDCQGNVVRGNKFPLDKCVKLPTGPGLFNELKQPAHYGIFSKSFENGKRI